MRISPKQLMVRKHVKVTFSIFGKFCSSCNHLVYFEKMYKADGKYYCTTCYKSREEVYDDVFLRRVTAKDVWRRNEMKKMQKTLRDIIEDVAALPDGEVSPSVHSIIMRQSIQLGLNSDTG